MCDRVTNHIVIIIFNIEPILIWIRSFDLKENFVTSVVLSSLWFSQTAELLWFLSWSKAAVLLPDVEICGAKTKINHLCDDTKGKPCAIIRKQVWPLTDHCAVWWKKIWRVQHQQYYQSNQSSTACTLHTPGVETPHTFSGGFRK